MSNEWPNNFEKKSEHIPMQEEVLAFFRREIKGARYKELLKLEDEKGLYLWRIEIPERDATGGRIEYEYMRKGNYREKGLPGGFSTDTGIDVVFLDSEGDATHGYTVVEFIDGVWKEIGEYSNP